MKYTGDKSQKSRYTENLMKVQQGLLDQYYTPWQTGTEVRCELEIQQAVVRL